MTAYNLSLGDLKEVKKGSVSLRQRRARSDEIHRWKFVFRGEIVVWRGKRAYMRIYSAISDAQASIVGMDTVKRL
jgi:hypothetical protein